MAYVRTPLNAKRVPKYLDLAFIDETPLTLDVASPRQMNRAHEVRAMRLLAAVHEATHFVALVDAGDPVFQVMVAPNPITRTKGNGGVVCGLNNGGYEDEWFTTLVGSAVEYLLLNLPGQGHYSSAFIHDFQQAENEARKWYTHEVEMDRLDGPAENHVAAALGGGRPGERAQSFILKHWPLIDLCATAFLIYGDRNGEVARAVIGEIKEVVARRLKNPRHTQHRSSSPATLRNSLPPDVLSIWREHSPHVELGDWPEMA